MQRRRTIHDLPCLPEMRDRIIAGISLGDVAKWLQTEKKEYTEVKLDSVVRMLHRYKNTIPKADLGIVDASATLEELQEVSAAVNEVDELSKLVRLQIARISIAHGVEQKINFTNQHLYKDINAATEMLLKLADLKFRHGTYVERPRTVELNHNIATSTTAFIDNMDPERRKRAGFVAAEMLKMLQAGPMEPINVPSSEAPDGVVDADYEIVTETPNGPQSA